MRFIAAIAIALAASLAIAEPAAWHARHPEHPGELLLLGSIHVLRESDHPLPPRIDALVAESEQVVFELDLDDMPALQVELGRSVAQEDLRRASLRSEFDYLFEKASTE